MTSCPGLPGTGPELTPKTLHPGKSRVPGKLGWLASLLPSVFFPLLPPKLTRNFYFRIPEEKDQNSGGISASFLDSAKEEKKVSR